MLLAVGFISSKTGSLTITKEIDDLLGKGNKEQAVLKLSIYVPWRLYRAFHNVLRDYKHL